MTLCKLYHESSALRASRSTLVLGIPSHLHFPAATEGQLSSLPRVHLDSREGVGFLGLFSSLWDAGGSEVRQQKDLKAV